MVGTHYSSTNQWEKDIHGWEMYENRLISLWEIIILYTVHIYTYINKHYCLLSFLCRAFTISISAGIYMGVPNNEGIKRTQDGSTQWRYDGKMTNNLIQLIGKPVVKGAIYPNPNFGKHPGTNIDPKNWPNWKAEFLSVQITLGSCL